MIKKTLYFLLATFLCSCSKDLDLRGLFYSEDNADERFEQSMSWNTMHESVDLETETDQYSFLVAGDVHAGGTENLDRFISRTETEEIKFAVIVGDLTTGHEADYLVFDEHASTNLSKTHFFITGNHDLFFDGWNSYYAHFGSSTYTFTVTTPAASDLFICLESGSGTLGSKQFNWLRNVLGNERSSYRNCTVFTHTNFFREHQTSSTNPMAEELEELLSLFSENNVNIVIMGHDHKHSEEWLGNTLYLTLDALEDNFEDASFAKIVIGEGNISYRFMPVQ
jgi:predicted phosphodiesterase